MAKVCWEFNQDDIPWEGGKLTFDLWQSKQTDGYLPSRGDFHPKDLISTLPSVMLVNVHRHPTDFSVRLVGTHIVEMMGRDPTGMRVADMRGGANLVNRFTAATDKASPYLAVDVETPFKSKQVPSYSVLVLPLADATGAVNMLMMSLHLAPHA